MKDYQAPEAPYTRNPIKPCIYIYTYLCTYIPIYIYEHLHKHKYTYLSLYILMAGCQNCGPFWDPDFTTAPSI